MSEPIKVGDLVVIVRGHICRCEGESPNVGRIFTVTRTRLWAGTFCCGCKTPLGGPRVLYYAPDDEVNGFPANRLKRIPPLDELEGEKREEGLKETS